MIDTNHKPMKLKNLILFIGAIVVLAGMTGCPLYEMLTDSSVPVEQNINVANKNQNTNIRVNANSNVNTNVNENTNVNDSETTINTNSGTNTNEAVVNTNISVPDFETPDSSGVIKEWELTSGDPTDTCTMPTYYGEVEINGWYDWEMNYGNREWLLRIADEDVGKIPAGLLANEDFADLFLQSPYVALQDASTELEEELKLAWEMSPATLTIKGFRTYCEGYPWVNFDGYPVE